ncbi:16S rRNA (guanine(527)-N(7))-methyltransferase RsmG [Roseobacteraceae bacterium S113]
MSGLDDVSRETLDALHVYEELITKWNPKINLVSPKSLQELKVRHFADSLEIARLSPEKPGHWLDLGSGGGFPGLVVAITLAADPGFSGMTLIESDQRKGAFMRTVIRELGLKAKVVTDRIENVAPQNADVISARALAPLPKLLGYCLRHAHETTRFLLPKGAEWRGEVEKARESYHFSLETHASLTHEDSINLVIGDLRLA